MGGESTVEKKGVVGKYLEQAPELGVLFSVDN